MRLISPSYILVVLLRLTFSTTCLLYTKIGETGSPNEATDYYAPEDPDSG